MAVAPPNGSRQVEYPRDAAAVLLIELDGGVLEVEASARIAGELCHQAGAHTVREAWDEEERARLWKGRKSAISALGRRFPSYYLQDGVVPRHALPEVLCEIQALSESHGLPVANVFHAGDGNLHPLILYRAGEPGVGSDKRCCMEWMFSPDDLATMQLVQCAFDPEGLANPAKIFPMPGGCAESAKRKAVLPGTAGLEAASHQSCPHS